MSVSSFFIKSPNLPESSVTSAAVSGTYSSVCKSLLRQGIQTILIKPHAGLAEPVSSHADMVLQHLGGNQVLIAQEAEYLIPQLVALGFTVEVAAQKLSSEYPHDIPLNAARIGKRLLAKEDALDARITEYCKQTKIQIIPVRQGYAKCSTVVVDEHSIITSDPSIAAAAKIQGLDVLQVRPGCVELSPYEYGFIGGTCGKLAKDVLAFAGDIRTHPDGEDMTAFAKSRGVEVLPLFDGPLVDIGGILPLTEKINA